LGEPINPDDTVDPYVDVVIRFEDGKVAMTTAYPNTISDEVRLASAASAIAQEMAANLPGVVGRDLFACAFTDLYSDNATLDELMGGSAQQIQDVPLLAPLKVVAAKYNEVNNAVILGVKFPDGRKALAITFGDELTGESESFIERISGTLLSSTPGSMFTPQEIDAIKKRGFFRGMEKFALECSIGYPKSRNDWGTGGKQFVYSDGLIVYLDNQNKVVDWQSLDNK
jgi:hypothetical protein